MREFTVFSLDNVSLFNKKLAHWSTSRFKRISILNSNNHVKHCTPATPLHSYDLIAAAGSLAEYTAGNKDQLAGIDRFISGNDDWLFGHLGYDLKNDIEDLNSMHHDKIGFPDISFFVPEYLFIVRGNKLEIGWNPRFTSEGNVDRILDEIMNFPEPVIQEDQSLPVESMISRDEYLEAVAHLMEHIQRGDIYEVNYCQEFLCRNAIIDPPSVWLKLIEVSPTPFSCYYRIDDRYLMCASPERFIKKTGSSIVSQPIKGTSARGANREEDLRLLSELANDPKERAENIMITDIVRNDLSKIASRASVRVDELCRIYPFRGIYQMQSAISAELPAETRFSDIVKAMFPMGSMTGAPKIRAMEIIEQYEKSKRGLYSGTVGFISPSMDFDFNVVIRSIQYNRENKLLSFMAGGAITSLSEPEKEYLECILKTGAILKVLA
jgi:para-aminobenzoate synthetase component I